MTRIIHEGYEERNGFMADKQQPVTLVELLRALEKSKDLRSLARGCGLSVRELRRRLARWRCELRDEVDAAGAGTSPAGVSHASPSGKSQGPGPTPDWPELTLASQVATNPLPRKGSQVLEIWTDGASKGNPGSASIGIVFGQSGGELLCSHCEVIGRATNNVAEYRAAVRALEFCQQWKVKRICMNVDSELIARQLTGVYRVKSPDLRPLYQQVVYLTRGFKSFRIRHVPREQNRFADHLANLAFSRHK